MVGRRRDVLYGGCCVILGLMTPLALDGNKGRGPLSLAMPWGKENSDPEWDMSIMLSPEILKVFAILVVGCV